MAVGDASRMSDSSFQLFFNGMRKNGRWLPPRTRSSVATVDIRSPVFKSWFPTVTMVTAWERLSYRHYNLKVGRWINGEVFYCPLWGLDKYYLRTVLNTHKKIIVTRKIFKFFEIHYFMHYVFEIFQATELQEFQLIKYSLQFLADRHCSFFLCLKSRLDYMVEQQVRFCCCFAWYEIPSNTKTSWLVPYKLTSLCWVRLIFQVLGKNCSKWFSQALIHFNLYIFVLTSLVCPQKLQVQSVHN